MEIIPQTLVGGLAQGSLYALAALGIIVIFNATQVVNFAQGAMGVAATYAAWFCLVHFHLPYLATIAIALIVAFAIGVLVESVLLRHIVAASTLTQIVVTLGLFMLLIGSIGLIFGFNPHAMPEVLPLGSLALGPVIVRPEDALDLGVLISLGLGLAVLFRRTKLGLGMRAITQDIFAAQLMGVPLRSTLSIAWGIGIAIAGITAVLAAPVTTLTPTMMDTLIIYGFVAAIVGGFGTFSGAIVGGLVVGIVDNLIKTYLAPELSLTFVFALLILTLYVRPNGFFGREVAQKV